MADDTQINTPEDAKVAYANALADHYGIDLEAAKQSGLGLSEDDIIDAHHSGALNKPIAASTENTSNEDNSNLLGANLGFQAAKVVDPYIGGAYATKYLYDKAPELINKASEAWHNIQTQGDKWAFGKDPGLGGITGDLGPGGDSVAKAAANYRMQRDLPSELSPKYAVNRESIIVPKDVAAEQQAARLATQKTIPGKIAQASEFMTSGLPKKILGTALPWATLPLSGMQGWEAYKNYAPNKDLLSRQNIQAGISGLGALGTAAATYPPYTLGGSAIGAAAPIVNAIINKAYATSPEEFGRQVNDTYKFLQHPSAETSVSPDKFFKNLNTAYGVKKSSGGLSHLR